MEGKIDANVKVLAWNIRSGGGVRVEGIFQQLLEWDADILALSEFRGTSASQSLSAMLRGAGWSHQASTARIFDKTNGLLIASRWPVTLIEHRIRIDPFRWLSCWVHGFNSGAKPLFIGSMHVPNRVSGRKDEFQQGVIRFLKKYPMEFGLLVGDTNSGIPGVDEQSPAFGAMEENWIRELSKRGWVDGFRHLRGDQKAYSWYSPNGNNGFRLDYAYLSPKALDGLKSVSYQWGKNGDSLRREVLSDHAAILASLVVG